MLLEKIKTPGLAHLSYLVGSGNEAAVIDPRRDCEIYLDKARAAGLEITHIFETHRNEDLVSGAKILAGMTGAQVHHGPHADGEVVYADTVHEGDRFRIGQLQLQVLETPGHTFDHVAYVLVDCEYADGAVGVFTGDALFVGDVGRTDFYPDRREEVAGQLHDSLQKILSLGDHVLIYPAHGAGSVCGSGMAEREFSTLGHERRNNPLLKSMDRDTFIQRKVNEFHYQPPYFRLMEKLNLQGGAPVPRNLRPRMLSLDELKACDADHLIDIRDPMAYAAGHLSGAISLPVGMIPAFAGWFIREEDTLALIASDENQLAQAMTHLVRIALNNVIGGYTGVIAAAAGGEEMCSIPMIGTGEVRRRLHDHGEGWQLLDVRDHNEREAVAIDGSLHRYIGEILQGRWQELDRSCAYTLMCASGMRATIVAGWLEHQGFERLDVYLGSMGAWLASRDGTDAGA